MTAETGRSVRPWRLLGVALVAQCGISVIEQGIPTLTGFIKTDLGLSAAAAGLAVSAFAIGKIFGSYAAGVAADRLGERRVLIFGALAAATLVSISAALPLTLFFVLLIAAGMAGAASTPAGGRLVLVAFPRHRHGLALGIRQTGIPIGGLVAAALLPWVAHVWSWRWSLVVAATVTALAVVPLVLSRIEAAEEPERPVRPGRGGDRAGDRNVKLLTLWGCLVVSGQYAILAFLALDLRRGAGLTLAEGSLLVAVANGSGVVGRIGWGAISDRALSRGRKPLLLALTAGSLVGALLLFVTPRSAPIGVLAAVAALAGLTLIGYQGLWIAMVADAVGPARVGAASGFAISFVSISIAASPPLYGLIADLAGGYRAIWAALALVLALAFVPAALVRESGADGEPGRTGNVHW